MQKLKPIPSTAGILLLLLSAASIYAALLGLSELRPAESYEDRGVLVFRPYAVYPVQVENTRASGRERRMNPTKIVYMVYYRATDGSGYRWSDEVYSRDHGRRVVEAGETVARRVLSIPEAGTYITVEPDQTAESYTNGLRQTYTRTAALSILYILLYIFVLLLPRRLRKGWEEDTEETRFGPEIKDPWLRRR